MALDFIYAIIILLCGGTSATGRTPILGIEKTVEHRALCTYDNMALCWWTRDIFARDICKTQSSIVRANLRISLALCVWCARGGDLWAWLLWTRDAEYTQEYCMYNECVSLAHFIYKVTLSWVSKCGSVVSFECVCTHKRCVRLMPICLCEEEHVYLGLVWIELRHERRRCRFLYMC